MLRRAVIEVGPQRCSNPNPNPDPKPDPDPGPNPNPNPDHNPDPNQVGPKRWSAIALAVHGRSGKQCRLRWCNQIDPDIKHESWTDKEDATIIRACRRAVHTPAARRSSGQGRPWSWRGLEGCPGLGGRPALVLARARGLLSRAGGLGACAVSLLDGMLDGALLAAGTRHWAAAGRRSRSSSRAGRTTRSRTGGTAR